MSNKITLARLPIRVMARISEIKGDSGFIQRMREMGFGESSPIVKISGSGPFVCQIDGARIVFNLEAARNIVVTASQDLLTRE